jgi:hypothetical protein
MGQEQQAPPDQRKEEPIISRHIQEIDDDQQGIHRDIDEQMDEEAPHPRIGENRLFAPGALKQERKVVGGDADAPTGKHPDEPDMIGIAVEIERGEKADHQDVDAKVDDECPHGAILRHGLRSLGPAVALLRPERTTPNRAPKFYGLAPSRRLRM